MFFKDYWLLWQNARNLQYIKWNNFSIAKKIADSKLRTKEFLKNKWISVPKTLLIIRNHSDIVDSIALSLNPPFVVKPNNWYWWKWILIIDSIDSVWNYVTNTWETFSKKELFLHFNYILDWFFSLSGTRDKVLIEKKVVLSSEIDLLWKYWLPDIRVIVFNMVPVMAMLRVPTKESWGKANLHGWACWVWIDIWTWKLTYITKAWKIIKSIPWIWDVRWIKLPFWDKVLEIAVSVQETTWIRYLWCDIVLDKELWPIILEMNIRAWLEVQVTNLSPLKARLEKVEWIVVNSVEKGVRLWRDLFSWDIEEKIKNITWKEVLWTKEYLTISVDKKDYKYLVNVKVSQNASYIDKNFLENILKISSDSLKKIKLNCEILWKKKNINFSVKDLKWINIILWVNSLKWFLVDPFKYKKWELPVSSSIEWIKWKNIAITKNYKKQILSIDKALLKIDKKLLILKYVTPKNLLEEKRLFIQNAWDYIPKLEYNECLLDFNALKEELELIEIPEIHLNWIYKRKKEEIFNKIAFLEAFKKQDTASMYNLSRKIFWDIDIENFEYSKKILLDKEDIRKEDELLSFDEIKDHIRKFNHIYWIRLNLKKWNWTSRFAMKWSSLICRESAEVWKREMRSVIAHEVEWHYLRKINWKMLDFQIFSHGTAWYIEIEEWIAIYNQSRFLSKTDRKYYGMFERYFFLHYSTKYSYRRLAEKMLEYYNYDYEKVFNYIVRIKRWFKDITKPWCFMKDVVYVNWFLQIKDYLDKWWDLKELYIWKIHIKDIEEIKNSYILDLNLKDLKIPFFL